MRVDTRTRPTDVPGLQPVVRPITCDVDSGFRPPRGSTHTGLTVRAYDVQNIHLYVPVVRSKTVTRRRR
jgi:hypothetical protein